MIEIKKKICLVGDFSVGKTSLVQQYVNQVFSEKYLTTIGVKIDTKVLSFENKELKLVVWDVAGRDSLSPINTSYLVGAAGFVLVLDGTRLETIHSAAGLVKTVRDKIKDVPFIVLVNKNDLQDSWEFNDQYKAKLEDMGWYVAETSAKTGDGVEAAFIELANRMLKV